MKKFLKSKFGQSLAGFLVALAIKGIRLTCKVTYHNTPNFEGDAVIFAGWHGRLIMLPYMAKKPLNALISEHSDGVVISKTASCFGIDTIAGSSTRGGVRALKMIVKALRSGTHVFITPDGPKGPRHEAKVGVLESARMSGAVVVPMSFSASSFWQMKSWDSFIIPKPFSRIKVVYGDVIDVKEALEKDSKEDVLSHIQSALIRVEEKADDLCA